MSEDGSPVPGIDRIAFSRLPRRCLQPGNSRRIFRHGGRGRDPHPNSMRGSSQAYATSTMRLKKIRIVEYTRTNPRIKN